MSCVDQAGATEMLRDIGFSLLDNSKHKCVYLIFNMQPLDCDIQNIQPEQQTFQSALKQLKTSW